jgi:tryptophan synthase beta chain
MEIKKIILKEEEIPKNWYNILADMKFPLDPPLDPVNREPITPDFLSNIFPISLLEQEMSDKRWIPIPEEVLKVYSLWRPTPLIRAKGLEEYLDTPARIYYKYEGGSPTGSHKANTSVAQAYYNMKEGIRRLTTETGAGQWGSALAFGAQLFGLKSKIYMVKVSYHQKPYRRVMMEGWGGEVVPSPSDLTEAGRNILKETPDSLGSLGIAISEAIEEAANDKYANYTLGSVLNHVLLHQTVIGLESKSQFNIINDYPDVIIGCCGGGSNLGGISLPFIIDGKNIKILAVEPVACPTLTKGEYSYDFGDAAGLTPLLKMYTLGHDFVPAGIHAGGLRYHGESPIISKLYNEGIIGAVSYPQNPVFEAALIFAKKEGIFPAPEAAHAIKAVIDEALRCKDEGKSKSILFNLSGHGHFDMSAYEQFINGKLTDYEHS